MVKKEFDIRKTVKQLLLYIIPTSVLIGFLVTLFAYSIKIITDYLEERIYVHAGTTIFVIILPAIGLMTIYLIRKYLFQHKENKGIKELLDTRNHPENNLPSYKIVSHFFDGILTVIFGGSTGIEVSTVVSSGTIGNVIAKKNTFLTIYKNVFISSAVAASLTSLFLSPLAGLFFSIEVLRSRLTIYQIVSLVVSIGVALTINIFLETKSVFEINVPFWNIYAIPYFILLGIFAGLNSVYLTKTVLFFKKLLKKFTADVSKILITGIIIGITILLLPFLYGDGYNSIHNLLFYHDTTFSLKIIGLFALTLLFKPVITALTLSVGGDGGVFAPSLFMGAFLGFLTSLLLNNYFGIHVIEVNFVIIGMAAVLSSSIHAPLTASFLVCSLTGNYVLLLPILLACIVSKITANTIIPYTVYSYKG
jgi:CIC family chloride channel protein